MKLSRLTPVVFIVWLVFYMFGNNMLPVTDPVESNYALTAKKWFFGDWLSPQIYGTYWYDKPIMIYCSLLLALKSLELLIGWCAYRVLFLVLCRWRPCINLRVP